MYASFDLPCQHRALGLASHAFVSSVLQLRAAHHEFTLQLHTFRIADLILTVITGGSNRRALDAAGGGLC